MEAPEERNATHESHKQWRIADRRQGTTDIGNKENKEDRQVGLTLSPGIGTKKRTDQNHTCAGRTDPACKSSADQDKDQVHLRRALQISLYSNVTCHAEQAEQQYDKGKVVTDDCFQKLLAHC